MEKATWEEIKSLASDFKRTQAISSNQKLTDRNCIDILNYLSNNTKQLSLHFTTDGKSFLTSQELDKEILEELEFSNGRIELTKLSSQLSIDLDMIECAVQKLASADAGLHLVSGNTLVSSSFIRQVALSINSLLRLKHGAASLQELALSLSLPRAFVERVLLAHLGSAIAATRHGDSLYTREFLRRVRAAVRGYLSRASKPVALSSLPPSVSPAAVPERVVAGIVSELAERSRVSGRLAHGRREFSPDIHAALQRAYALRFFQQNSFLDFHTVRSLGVANPARFVADLPIDSLTVLSSVAVGDAVLAQIDAAVLDDLDPAGFVDALELLPAAVATAVTRDELGRLLRERVADGRVALIAERFAVSRAMVERAVECLEPLVRQAADRFARDNWKAILSGQLEAAAPDPERDAKQRVSRFKSGGGLRGREVKLKAVKNKFHHGAGSAPKPPTEARQARAPAELVSPADAVDTLAKCFELDLGDDSSARELLAGVHAHVQPRLAELFAAECRRAVLQSARARDSRAELQALEAAVTTALGRIRLFERAIAEIEDDADLRVDLARYALKTLCADLAGRLFERVAADLGLDWQAGGGSSEARAQLVAAVPPDWAGPLRAVGRALRDDSGSFQPFYGALEALCARLELSPPSLHQQQQHKKTDKLAAQEIAAQYRSIIESTADAIEPGQLLLLTTMLLFQRSTGLPLHASGKFVPALLEFLRRKGAVPVDWDALKQYERFVVALAAARSRDQEIDELRLATEPLHRQIIDIGLNWNKLK